MSCSEYIIYIKENRRICEDIRDLLDKLEIPFEEQAILWNVANQNMCYKKFREILSTVFYLMNSK